MKIMTNLFDRGLGGSKMKGNSPLIFKALDFHVVDPPGHCQLGGHYFHASVRKTMIWYTARNMESSGSLNLLTHQVRLNR